MLIVPSKYTRSLRFPTLLIHLTWTEYKLLYRALAPCAHSMVRDRYDGARLRYLREAGLGKYEAVQQRMIALVRDSGLRDA